MAFTRVDVSAGQTVPERVRGGCSGGGAADPLNRGTVARRLPLAPPGERILGFPDPRFQPRR